MRRGYEQIGGLQQIGYVQPMAEYLHGLGHVQPLGLGLQFGPQGTIASPHQPYVRVTGKDTAGRTVRQTVIDAYKVS